MRRPLLLSVLGLLLVAAAVPLGRWWSHPDLFEDHGDGFLAAPRPLARSALSIGVTYPSRSDGVRAVTFAGARVHFADDSAAARTELAVCTPVPGADPIGAVRPRDLARFCTRLRPVADGTRMDHVRSRSGEYVVLTLRPTRPGRVRVDRVDLDYALGAQQLFRRGTDTVAVDVTVRAR